MTRSISIQHNTTAVTTEDVQTGNHICNGLYQHYVVDYNDHSLRNHHHHHHNHHHHHHHRRVKLCHQPSGATFFGSSSIISSGGADFDMTQASLPSHDDLAPNPNSSLTSTTSHVTWDSSSECHEVPYAFHFVTGLVMALVGIFCIFGNAIVLCTFARNVRLRTSSNLLIINLTIADFVMAVVDFPIFTVSSLSGCWRLGFEGCQVYGLTSSVSGLVAINTLAAISFDRYVVVVRRLGPIDRMAKSTVAMIIVIIWFFSLLWSLVPFTGVSAYRLEGMGTSCTFNYVDQSFQNRIFFLSLVTFNFFIPLVIIVFSYTRIYISVCQIKREVKLFQRTNNLLLPSGTNGHSNNGRSGSLSSAIRHQLVLKAEVKTAIVSIFIISVFCITWTPYVIIGFVGVFYNPDVITPTVSMLPNMLAKVATATNALLYSIGHPEVRKRVKKLLYSHVSQDSYIRPTSNTVHSSPPVSNHECLVNLTDLGGPSSGSV